jgi:23S rRNA (pseudouridine1915-N3)-methyltransferase
MKLLLITHGKTDSRYVLDGIEEYSKRLVKYCDWEMIELPDPKNAGRLSVIERKSKEKDILLPLIQPNDYLILFDEQGKEYTSIELAKQVQSWQNSGRKRVVLVIGGPYGFADEVKKRADISISLSKLTFNHQMVRMIAVEQLYRAFTILRNEPYHHQ